MLYRIAVILSALLVVAVAARGEEPSHTLLVQRTGQPPHTLTLDQIDSLKAFTQQAAIEHADRTWTGPLLWDVLVDADAVNPGKPAEVVHLGVRIIGSDGWTAVFGLAELSPEFAGKPIQLANKMDGAPIAGQGLRLIVPGERRGGRSVRDVVRIDIE